MNLLENLYRVAGCSPQRKCIHIGRATLSYVEVLAEVELCVERYLQQGLQTGHHLGLLSENNTEGVVLYLAALKMGIGVTCFNTRMPVLELSRYMAGAAIDCFIFSGLEPKMEKEVRNTIPGALSVENLLITKPVKKSVSFSVSPQMHATYLLTSGTTGKPKTVVYTYQSLKFTIDTIQENFWELKEDDVCLLAGSLSHIFGQTICLASLSAGCSLSILGSMNPAAIFSSIHNHGVTFIAGVPMLANLLLYSPLRKKYDISSLKKMMLGGSYVSPELVTKMKEELEIDVITGYGMTEGVPLSYLNVQMMQDAPAGTVGKVAERTALRIVDANGDDVSIGDYGEILVKGPQLALGYLENSKLTEFTDGWLRTGDIGKINENGYLFWSERQKDVIKVLGNTIFPTEVERILMQHPLVKEAAVVGIPHTKAENILRAFIVSKDRTLTAGHLKDYCDKNLIYYKHPSVVSFVDELPKNATGKVDKSQLIDIE